MFLNFLKVGFLNTFFGYSIYVTFLFLGFSFRISLIISTILGVLFNYSTFGKFVFRYSLNFKSLFKFIFLYVIVYFINFYLLLFLSKTTNLVPYIGQVVCIPFVILLNWFVLNFWVYEKR